MTPRPPEPRVVKVAWAQPGTDFNDMLRNTGPEAVCESFLGARPLDRPLLGSSHAADRAETHPGEARTPRGKQSARKSRSRASDNGGPIEPRAWGYDEDDLNQQFAFVLMGSKAVIFFEQPDAVIEDQRRILSLEAFSAWFLNKSTEVRAADGEIKVVTWARRWLQSPKRRSYYGVEFYPDPTDRSGTPGYLNLWNGFAVKPVRAPDHRRYAVFRDHLLTNVCNGNVEHFKWVFGFFAHMVQRPRERIGTALVLRGKMGSGKTKVGEVFGSLLPRHYFLVDDPRYVTGNFNAHMASCLLLQADEAVWAGDKSAEGRLKGLITSPRQQIEAKGVDPIPLPNYLRLVMTSNEEWVVPAGKDERRFAVLDVAPNCAQSHQYFREMDEQLADGGMEHLLGDLLAFDLGSVNLRQIPRTDALLEQKIRSLNSVESWWFERLSSGSTGRHSSKWEMEIPTATLFDDYIATADRIGVKRKSEETVFGWTLVKLMPCLPGGPTGLKKVRPTRTVKDENGCDVTRRVTCYQLPSLAEARAHFERAVGQTITWPSDGDEQAVGKTGVGNAGGLDEA
jgi:hypothetical protein